jgi:putative hydrolase of the HAD superfamily
MTNPRIELLVLDAHGVVLNSYWPCFLGELARRVGRSEESLIRRWRETVRLDAWSGHIDDCQLWRRLGAGQKSDKDLRDLLEKGYTHGPAASRLRRWAQRMPIWLLSNHRTSWLVPRMARLNLLDFFDRILVSDVIGSMKPDPAAFREVLRQTSRPQRVLFVDDQLVNVLSARRLGLTALHAEKTGHWLGVVDRLLDLAPARTSS